MKSEKDFIIDVLGSLFVVSFIHGNGNPLNRESHLGFCKNCSQEITIDGDFSAPEQTFRTLSHELIHAIDWILKIKDNGAQLTESETDRLALGFSCIFRNLPKDILERCGFKKEEL